ncbi:MAG: SpoIIIAH-like family protein [Clostridia bacterium]|nr:SpoIIIAH-like family protein [Clostridia bacterium]
MKKRTKMIIITAMVLLLGVTGYLNIMLNNSVSDGNINATTTTASYFSTYRSTRESTRDQELLYYDAIISNEASTADAIANAESLKLSLIAQMEHELVIEGLIKAKGFEDCIVSILDENVNAVVKAKELTSSEVAQILSVIQSQLNTSLENVTIIPVE